MIECELDIDEKNEICHGKILKKAKEVISRNSGEARTFGDYNFFKERIRKK